MNENFEIFKTSMPSSRPADYYLGCLDGSVFIDFNNSNKNLIYLTRISFDGYGCCNIEKNGKPMDEIDSENFRNLVNAESINQKKLSELIIKTINANKNLLWIDALEKYGFL